MAGFFSLQRGWQDHPALGGRREPLCRRAAWAWMVERARWKAGDEDVGGVTVQLHRGQFCASYRYLGEAWEWPVAKVQRFIDRLKTDTLIETALEHGRMVVTICNYDEIQGNGSGEDHIDDTAPDTAAIRDRYGSDTKEKKGIRGKRGRSPLTPQSDEQRWRGRLRAFDRRFWSQTWGPSPEEPGCKAPPDLIAEWISHRSPHDRLFAAAAEVDRRLRSTNTRPPETLDLIPDPIEPIATITRLSTDKHSTTTPTETPKRRAMR